MKKIKLMSLLLSLVMLVTLFGAAPIVPMQVRADEAADTEHHLLLPSDFADSLGTWVLEARTGSLEETTLQGKKLNKTTAPEFTAVSATSTITVKNSGTYKVWVRGWYNVQGTSNANSWKFGVSIDDVSVDKVFGGPASVSGFAWTDGGTVTLSAGEHKISIDDTYKMYARFDGILLTEDTTLVPSDDYDELMEQTAPSSIVIDNTDEGFSCVGSWSSSTYRAGYYGTDYVSLKTSSNIGKTATWSTTVYKPGYYDIYVWLPDGSSGNLCDNVTYSVTDIHGTNKVTYNQKDTGGEWKYLTSAPYTFGSAADVTLIITDALPTTGAVMADAIKLQWAEPYDANATSFILDGDDFTTSGYEGWVQKELDGAYNGSYWYTEAGDGGALLESNFYANVTGGYRIRVYKPTGLAADGMSSSMGLQIGNSTYSIDLTALKEGWNTVTFCKLNANVKNTVTVPRSENGISIVDAVEIEYVGYDLYYTDFETGSEALWTLDGLSIDGSLSGNNGKATFNDATSYGRVNMDVNFTAKDAETGTFGLMIAGNETDGYTKLSYNAETSKFCLVSPSGELLAESEAISTVLDGEEHKISVFTDEPYILVQLDGEKILQIEADRVGEIGIFTDGIDLSVASFGLNKASTSLKGNYSVDLNDPQQTIWGLGIEIQSDSINSGNLGITDDINAIPHDLTEEARERLYSEMLTGFRYMRMAGGLYYRGTDDEGKHLRERWDTQNEEIAELLERSGIEGVDLEFWSPTPYFKANGKYIVGKTQNTLKCFDESWEYYGDEEKTREFLEDFANTIVEDIKYLRSEGINVIQFGIQNEPKYTNTSYSHCYYSPEMYYQTAKVLYPIIDSAFPDMHIHADSMDGQNGDIGKLLVEKGDLLQYIDAWTFHRIGWDSNHQIDQATYYNSNKGRDDIVVYNNEFEYLDRFTNDWRCINTAQSIMNWMTFENSPTWHWLHALKPVGNTEAGGHSLGFWRKPGDTTSGLEQYSHIEEGDWDYNYQNWNSIRGFLKYMDWNSVRYTVNEDEVRYDQRIMSWKTPDGKLVIALTNRSEEDSFQFNIDTGLASNASFQGYRYTPLGVDEIELENRAGSIISPTLPPLSIEYWVQDADETMIPVDGVTLSKTEAELSVNASETLSFTVSPDNAANKNVTWTSSDSTVATVDENGKVTALKAGTAVITATALSGNGKYSADCTVTVTDELVGDVNSDSTVDREDAVMLRKILIGSETAVSAADVNKDGKTDICDLVSLENKL